MTDTPQSALAFDWSAGYTSQRAPVFGRNVVATSHPLGAQAGLRVLSQGGNAVDAAVAAAAAMTVLEPVSNGLGSDAFGMVWDGRALHGLNASGCAPQAWSPAYFQGKYGAQTTAPPVRGWDTVTVPGAVASWVALSRRFGKLRFAELMAPAIECAERGYGVTPIVQQKWAASVPLLLDQPGFAQAFMPFGRAPEVGERFAWPAVARGLRLIGETEGEAFYRGEIAQALVRNAQVHGAALSLGDLASYEPEWVQPLSHDYRGHTLHELPPNGQGLAALMALGMVRQFDLRAHGVDSVVSQHIQIEAMKLAFADVYRYVGDPASMPVSPQQMLDPDYLQARARLIRLDRAQAFDAGRPDDVHRRGGTVYLTVADAQGMMVSFIQSNYMGFGSGVVLPDYGVSLQNRGHSFSLDPRQVNVVAPGKRPFHTIIPGFLSRPGRGPGELEAQMAFGVMGANMQPQGQLQTLVRMLDFHQHPQAACDAPRWRFNAGLEINVEPNMPADRVQGLADLGHRMEVINDSYQDFGAGQFIWRLGDPAVDGYVAASDSRRDGQAVAW
ncbi:MAG: gamma-glutamyltransferase family protein [Pseudomonadota bacterium]